MSDDFLKEHQAAWRAQPDDFETVRARLKAERWAPHAALGIEAAGAAFGFLVGLWFIWMAAATGRVIFMLAGVVMLTAMPAGLAASVLARRGGLAWDDETPERLLRTGVRRAEAGLRAWRWARLSGVVIVAFVIVLWVFERAGAVTETWFVTVYTLVCIPFFAAGWLVARRRIRRLERERATYGRLLEEFEAETAADDEADERRPK